MTKRNFLTRTDSYRQDMIDQLKDEVYRQMFRLDAKRPGSEMDLAMALLYAWTASEPLHGNDQQRQWLKKVFPICLQMIEAKRQSNRMEQPCFQ
jgi:hypothetical protein